MGPFNYLLTTDSLQIRIRKWVVREVKFSDVESVREGAALWNEHWTNFLPFRYVTIVRKNSLISNFVINPPNRESFIKELKAKTGKSNSQSREP